ncbi:MAG: hypothetical protein RLZ98_3589 [Pseudomonadota bacterium]|jgi:hypothetical protein
MGATRELGVLAAAMLASTPPHAADWTHEIAPYLRGAGLEGTTAVGPVSADVDIDRLVLEGDSGYAFTDNLHGFVGLRYVDLERTSG